MLTSPSSASYARGREDEQRMATSWEMRSVDRGQEEPESFEEVLFMCKDTPNWQRALAALDGLRASGSAGVTTRSFNAAISSCSRAKRWECVLSLIDQMHEAWLTPDSFTVACASRVLQETGQTARAAALWEEMAQIGLKPDSRSINAALGSSTRGSHWNRSLEFLQLVQDSAGGDKTRAGITATLRTCAKAGHWERALDALRQLDALGIQPCFADFAAAIGACDRGRAWTRTIALLDEMVRERSLEPDALMFNDAIASCTKNQKWDQALSLLSHMQTFGPPPNACSFTGTIAACCSGRRLDTARWEISLSLLEEMLQPEIGSSERLGAAPCEVTFGAVISACEKGNKWELCLHLLDRMRDMDIEVTHTCVHAVIRACEKCRKWECALALLDMKIRTNLESRVLALTSTAGACDGAGQLHRFDRNLFGELAGGARALLAASVGGEVRNQDAGEEPRARRKEKDVGYQLVGYCNIALSRLRSSDMAVSEELNLWRRRATNLVEERLLKLYALGESQGEVPPPGLQDHVLKTLNDIGGPFTRQALSNFGLQGLAPSEGSPVWPAMRRRYWWEVDVLPRGPEEYFICGSISYKISIDGGRHRLRCPLKLVPFGTWERCHDALAQIHAFRDRVYHRGLHSERQALLALACRILLRPTPGDLQQPIGTRARGVCNLYVTHTPCLSCMATIIQFQGYFPAVSISVSFDTYQDYIPRIRDPWSAPRYPAPVRPSPSPSPWTTASPSSAAASSTVASPVLAPPRRGLPGHRTSPRSLGSARHLTAAAAAAALAAEGPRPEGEHGDARRRHEEDGKAAAATASSSSSGAAAAAGASPLGGGSGGGPGAAAVDASHFFARYRCDEAARNYFARCPVAVQEEALRTFQPPKEYVLDFSALVVGYLKHLMKRSGWEAKDGNGAPGNGTNGPAAARRSFERPSSDAADRDRDRTLEPLSAQRFFDRFPCDPWAQERFRRSPPVLQEQVQRAFRQFRGGDDADYSGLLLKTLARYGQAPEGIARGRGAEPSAPSPSGSSAASGTLA